MPRALFAIPFLLLLVAIPAQAQAEELAPVLELGVPVTSDAKPVPLDPAQGTLLAPWTYQFLGGADAAATFGGGEVTLTWSLTCVEAGLRFVGEPTTAIAYEAGKDKYEGTAQLPVTAAPDTPGETPLACVLAARASAAAEAFETNASMEFHPEAAYRGEIVLTTPMPRKAGPDKQVPFPIEVENRGNARTIVQFAVVSDPPGKRWDVLIPDELVLEAGQTDQVFVTVSTAYRTGYVKSDAGYVLQAIPTSARDPTLTGPAQEVTVQASTQGWYIPGPSPLLLAGVLGLAAAVVRRRSK